MIFEQAIIEIQEGREAAFENGVSEALPIFRRARGFHSMQLERSIETPSRYLLIVGWETVEDHVNGFRNSEDFQLWRSLVADTFAAPPFVEHTAIVLSESKP